MIFPFGKVCSMVDSMMLEIPHVKGIAGSAAVGVDDIARLDFPCNYWHQGAWAGVVCNHCAGLAAALQNSKNSCFCCCTPTTFSFAGTARTTFIGFDRAIKHFSRIHSKALDNNVANFSAEKCSRICGQTKKICCRGSNLQRKILKQF